jgi:hypothetical protein
VMKKGRLAVGLAGVAVAAGGLFPASAGAADPSTCIIECVGGPGAAGLTHALTVLETNPSAQDTRGELAVVDRLALNHNETVLTLS